MKQQHQSFEIILVSADSTANDFLKYYAEMPWLSVIWDNVDAVTELVAKPMAMRGIPHLVLMDTSTMSIITLDGRGEVMRDPYGTEFPWGSRLSNMLTLIPSPLKRVTKNWILKAQSHIKNILQGALSQFAPDKLIQFTIGAVKTLVKCIYYLLKKTIIAT
jgi:hypothetical protein